MDASSNPGDLKRPDHPSEPSPGGDQQVEESAGPESSSSSNPAGNHPVPAEDLAAPENPLPSAIGQAEELDGSAHLDDTASWEQVMQTLSLDKQLFFISFLLSMHKLMFEIINNRERLFFSVEEVKEVFGDVDNFPEILASIHPVTVDVLGRFFNHARRQLEALYFILDERIEVIALMDYLIRRSPRYRSNPSQGNNSSRNGCVICLEEYLEYQIMVILPCHGSHHFHRACIQDWLLGLVPGPLTCPICRTPMIP
ncbi:hypothetical protein VP01_421g12 [Puccinia sorghi]|uniref:RING-type domain-containing protein n=1 Tax=Puccinia sorghi TaxID=27349 RepID=A0A0L6UQM1_9BASI|nr:hypothetical protein VP01_421g12 [Puccinia sorghi]